jgi:hypothetical protein
MRVLMMSSFLLVLTACSSSVGHNFDTASIQKIQAGQTTQDELITMFGPPDKESSYPDGQRLMMWNYSEARTLNTTAGKTLTVQTKNGRVFSYTLSKS